MDLGGEIKKAREEKGLTQTDLGSLVGLSKSEISRYENGSRIPRTVKLTDLAKCLGLSLEELMRAETIEKEGLVWGTVLGGPHEVVYLPTYQNQVDKTNYSYTYFSAGHVAATGAVLKQGKYIWVINGEGCPWIRQGTRLLVYITKEIEKNDLVTFLHCNDWIWVGTVLEFNGGIIISFDFSGSRDFLLLEKVKLLGKVVHLALDI